MVEEGGGQGLWGDVLGGGQMVTCIARDQGLFQRNTLYKARTKCSQKTLYKAGLAVPSVTNERTIMGKKTIL